MPVPYKLGKDATSGQLQFGECSPTEPQYCPLLSTSTPLLLWLRVPVQLTTCVQLILIIGGLLNVNQDLSHGFAHMEYANG